MNTTRFFMQQDSVHTTLSGSAAVVCLRAQSTVLAETRLEQEKDRSALLAADSGDSVLRAKSRAESETVAYTAYGVHSPSDIPAQRPAFNGHLLLNQLYLLGNGYRGYSPVLMRFQSPDSFSPFGVGGLNCYAYCAGDPINFSDPSGHGRTSRPPSPNGVMSSTTAEKLVLDALNTQSWWRENGGMRRRSSATMDQIVSEALNSQPGWNISDASGQSSSQHSQAKIFAHASQLPTTSYPASNPASLPSSGGGTTGAHTAPPLSQDDANFLLSHYKGNNHMFRGVSLEDSRRVRAIVINTSKTTSDPIAAVRQSGIPISDKQISTFLYSYKAVLRKRPHE